MSGDSTTSESLQTYILGIYKDYISFAVELKKYLLAKRDGGQSTTFRLVFENFFSAFVTLYDATKYLSSSSKVNALKTPIDAWIEASYGILSGKKDTQTTHAKEGISHAESWIEFIHSEEIIKKTEV